MHLNYKKLLGIIIAVCLNCVFVVRTHAQKADIDTPEYRGMSLMASGSILANGAEDVGASLMLGARWMCGKYLDFAAGLSFYRTKIEAPSWTDPTTRVEYWIDNDEPVRRFNAVAAVNTYLPILKRAGITAGASVQFEPIPVALISISKYLPSNSIIRQSKSVSKVIFTRFSPGAFLEAGLYYDLNENLRVALTCCMGYYDPYLGNRCAVIDGQKIGDHMDKDNIYYGLTLKIIGLRTL